MDLTTTMRERVERLERTIEHLPQVECQVFHHFAPGVYAREMRIPAGTIATGAVHKTEHLSILSAGHCLLTTDEGVVEIHAPYIGKSKPGIKRSIVTITACVLTTIHPTTTTDLDELVEELTESTAAELLGGPKNKQLAAEKQRELENKA